MTAPTPDPYAPPPAASAGGQVTESAPWWQPTMTSAAQPTAGTWESAWQPGWEPGWQVEPARPTRRSFWRSPRAAVVVGVGAALLAVDVVLGVVVGSALGGHLDDVHAERQELARTVSDIVGTQGDWQAEWCGGGGGGGLFRIDEPWAACMLSTDGTPEDAILSAEALLARNGFTEVPDAYTDDTGDFGGGVVHVASAANEDTWMWISVSDSYLVEYDDDGDEHRVSAPVRGVAVEVYVDSSVGSD